MKLIIIFILFAVLLSANSDLAQQFINRSEIFLRRKDYVNAYNNLIEAEQQAENNNHLLKNIYHKLGELCEITNNYDSAIVYYTKYSDITKDEIQIDNTVEKILNITYKRDNSPDTPVSLERTKINIIKSQSFLQNIKLNVSQQSFKVDEPVRVAGVRGADELKIDENLVYDDLQINLEYIQFTNEEIENFLNFGNLKSYDAEREKLSLRKFILSQDEEIKNGEISAQILKNNFIQQNRYCSVNRLNKYPQVLIKKGISNKQAHTERIYYINLLYKILTEQTARSDLNYKVDVFFDENINAFTTTSGYVFISESFLNIMSNEDELAAVLAHELAHITLRHHAASKGKSKVTQAAVKHFLSDKSSEVQTAATVLDNTLISNSFERRYEYEADAKAIEYLVKMGYNPFALLTLLEAFLESERINNRLIGSFMNNHPHPQDRIDRLNQVLKSYNETEFYSDEYYKRQARFEYYIKPEQKINISVIKEPPEKVIKEEKESTGSKTIKQELKKGLKKFF